MNNLFNAVQVAAGFTREQMADALGVALPTYDQRRKPMCGEYRIKELRSLYNAVPEPAKNLLLQAVKKYISAKEY